MNSGNSSLDFLREEVGREILEPFRFHGWSAEIVREIDRDDCIVITARRGAVTTQIAVLYSSIGISKARYTELSGDVARIFVRGLPYMIGSVPRGLPVPVEPLDDFFPFLVDLNKQVDPDCSPPIILYKPPTVLRLTAENPLDAIIARLQQFTSSTLARRLVERRATTEAIEIRTEVVDSKAIGIAYLMRGALDYLDSTPRDALNKRVLGLYYGTMALAQAEMLASPSGPTDLDEVERMTQFGHGLYALPTPKGGFAELQVGVLAGGFFPKWMKFLGHDTSSYPQTRPRSASDLEGVPTDMVCSLQDLFASMPEIDDLFAEVFGGPAGWVSIVSDKLANGRDLSGARRRRNVGSTYVLLFDRSGQVPSIRLESAGWPLAEIRQAADHEGARIGFRARIDHTGHDRWSPVLPTHSSPYVNSPALVLPTVGGAREYRTIAAVTLYALSIMVRYMPSAWRRIEGGDEDQYLALVRTALAVWERLLPEHFLESIAGETVRATQPGSFLA